MQSIKMISDNKIKIIIDLSIYGEQVISKVLYWLTDIYIIFRKNINNNKQQIILQKKDNSISSDEFSKIKNRLNQDFIDYKTREIITNETKNIRDILYIKAFANNDDFEDFNITAN